MFNYTEQQLAKMKALGYMQLSSVCEYLEENETSPALALEALDREKGHPICHMGMKCLNCDRYFSAYKNSTEAEAGCFIYSVAHYEHETGYQWEEDLIDPWTDSTSRFPLTDEGAITEWTEDAVKDWCAKANKALETDGETLKRLKTWSENTYCGGEECEEDKDNKRNMVEFFGLRF